MPKSRSKRKKTEKVLPGEKAIPLATTKLAHSGKAGTNGTLVSRGHVPASILQELDTLGKQRFRLVLLAPLVFGTIAVTSARAERLSSGLLFMVVAALAVARPLATWKPAHRVKRIAARLALVLIGTVALVSFLTTSQNFSALIFLLSAVVLLALSEKNDERTPRVIVAQAFTVFMISAILGVLGVFCQLPNALFLHAAALGVPTGALLAGAIIAAEVSHFERAGWRRRVARQKKDQLVGERPGLLAQLYACFVLLVPATIIMGVPLGIFPAVFIVLVVPVYYGANLCTQFLEAQVEGGVIAQKTIKLSLLTAVLVLVASFFLGR